MRDRIDRRRLVLIPVAVLVLSSCAQRGSQGWVELEPESGISGPTFRITGTVHYLDLERGDFVIRDKVGTQYHPVNLPETYRIEGMAVEAEARARSDIVSIGMVGQMVELLRIRQR